MSSTSRCTGFCSSLAVIEIREQQEHQAKNENRTHPVERIQRGEVEHQYLDHSEPSHRETRDPRLLQVPPETDGNECGGKDQPPRTDGQTGSEVRVCRGERLKLEVAVDLARRAEENHRSSNRPEAAMYQRREVRGCD